MHIRRTAPLVIAHALVLLMFGVCIQAAFATDYFLCIGGGYNPQGNQASLEANVIFFQQVLREHHASDSNRAFFFADGLNEEPDLQVVKPESAPPGPLSDLLKQLHARGNQPEVEYRNHQVPNLAGPISPKNIENSLRRNASAMRAGDRLIVYVTAHGEPATGENKHNTLISCWQGEKISGKQFTGWLDAVPAEVPVVLVMAQCYCGGFAHAIFNDLESDAGLNSRSLCGFFAQQHDLAAAGCRPDIENDEEYSSFFWGAFAGRSRNGRQMQGVDCNRDGKISFAEAHAQAIVVSETIDIPLRTSDVVLRRFSRIANYEHRGMPQAAQEDPAQAVEGTSVELNPMQGSLASMSKESSADVQRVIGELSKQLGIAMQDDVTTVFEAYAAHSKVFADLRRTRWRGRRDRGSGRRQLREEIGAQWQELADRDSWRSSDWLKPDRQASIMAEIRQLPSYERTQEFFRESQQRAAELEATEIRDVKYQRLIQALESVVLASNLPRVAEPAIVQRYQEILELEDSCLDLKTE